MLKRIWRKKKHQYNAITSAAVSFFSIKKIYCVEFLFIAKWFDSLEEAEAFKSIIFEKFFYSSESILLNQQITIKEYIVDV